MAQLIDSSHRPIRYLRISVTDRCNFRCIYCQPAEGIKLLNREDILKYEEIISVARAAAELGITKIRLTGGEPLVRANLKELISELAKINGIDDISLTTNGMLLSQYAAELMKAGLKRVNISLDSLNSDKFEKITRTDKLGQVLEGIEVAKKVGLNPVKINVVAMRGINDDEILDFARLTLNDGWHIRFIELMPFGSENPPEEHNIGTMVQLQQFVSVQEIKDKISEIGKLEPSATITGNGPAKYFRLPAARGTIGFISPVSEHFCFNCNRIRLTADGKLRPCLLSDKEVDLRLLLRTGAAAAQVRQKIVEAIQSKPVKHELAKGSIPKNRSMSQVGG
jgi:cyclic pyranopterin phosphate synthase